MEIIITLAPDAKVLLPMVRSDNQVVEQPRYYVRMPELTCEFVRTNQLTQAELAQATALQGGIALNYVYPHLIRRQIPASSTEDWITFNSLSKSMAGWIGYCQPVLYEAKPLVCHEPMAPSKAVADGASPIIANKSFSGWEHEQNSHFEYLPLPLFGDGEVQTQLGDIKYPPKPREWRRRLYDNRNWTGNAEPSAWNYPQSSAKSYSGVLNEFNALLNTSATYECQRDVFDANPFWPATEQARWNPAHSSMKESTSYLKTEGAKDAVGTQLTPTSTRMWSTDKVKSNIRSISYANSKAKSSGSNKYPTDSQWMMCEYLSALKPSESRLTQSGVDVDRVGNHAQIRIRRPDVSQMQFPHGFAYVGSGQKYAVGAVDAVTGLTLAMLYQSSQPAGYNYQTPGNTSRYRPFHYQFKLTDAAVQTTLGVTAASGALDGAYIQVNADGTNWCRVLQSTWDGTNFTVIVMAPFQKSVVSTWTTAVGVSFQKNSGYHTVSLGNHFIMDGQEECSCFLVVQSGALANIAAMEREFLGKWMCMTPNTGTAKHAASVMGQIVAVDALGITNYSITGGTPTSTWTTPDAYRVGTLVINVADIQGGLWSTTATANAWEGARVITKQAGLFYGGTLVATRVNNVVTVPANTAITTTNQASVTLQVKWDTANVMGTGGTFTGDAVESFIWIYAKTTGSAGTTECQITMRGVRRFDWRVNPNRVITTNGAAVASLASFGIGSLGWITDDYETINDLTNDHLDFTANPHVMNPITYLEYFIWVLENRTVFWSNSGQIAVSH